MSWRSTIPRYAFLILWILLAATPITQAESRDGALPAALVTPDILQAEIATAEVATDLNDEACGRLVGLCRESLRNLEIARSNQETASKFQAAADPSGC